MVSDVKIYNSADDFEAFLDQSAAKSVSSDRTVENFPGWPEALPIPVGLQNGSKVEQPAVYIGDGEGPADKYLLFHDQNDPEKLILIEAQEAKALYLKHYKPEVHDKIQNFINPINGKYENHDSSQRVWFKDGMQFDDALTHEAFCDQFGETPENQTKMEAQGWKYQQYNFNPLSDPKVLELQNTGDLIFNALRDDMPKIGLRADVVENLNRDIVTIKHAPETPQSKASEPRPVDPKQPKPPSKPKAWKPRSVQEVERQSKATSSPETSKDEFNQGSGIESKLDLAGIKARYAGVESNQDAHNVTNKVMRELRETWHDDPAAVSAQDIQAVMDIAGEGGYPDYAENFQPYLDLAKKIAPDVVKGEVPDGFKRDLRRAHSAARGSDGIGKTFEVVKEGEGPQPVSEIHQRAQKNMDRIIREARENVPEVQARLEKIGNVAQSEVQFKNPQAFFDVADFAPVDGKIIAIQTPGGDVKILCQTKPSPSGDSDYVLKSPEDFQQAFRDYFQNKDTMGPNATSTKAGMLTVVAEISQQAVDEVESGQSNPDYAAGSPSEIEGMENSAVKAALAREVGMAENQAERIEGNMRVQPSELLGLPIQ